MSLLQKALGKQMLGLFVINGVDPSDDAADFFLGWLTGCALLLDRLAADAEHQAFVRDAAQCTPEQLTQAVLMVRRFRASNPCPPD